MKEMEKPLGTQALALDGARIAELMARRGITHRSVQVVYESASTNADAREYCEKHGRVESVCIADGQSAGRGRLGRSFASPHGAGIYMSILTCPDGEIGDFTAVTTFAAVAVCRAIERVSGIVADIKWVNDIYYGGKKLGGILTEGALAEDMRSAKYVIVGIGLNVLRSALPEELSDIAISLEEIAGEKYDRNLLISEIVSEFDRAFSELSSPRTREEYKRRCFVVGKDVTVHKPDGSYDARVIGIGDDMSLWVKRSDGNEEKLITGEISVRTK